MQKSRTRAFLHWPEASPTPDRRAQVRQAIHENATFTPTFAVMNALSATVAAYGLLADSTAVVIGAMVIAMLLGPISGIALALLDGDNTLLRRALWAEGLGVAIVLAIAFAIGRVHSDLPITREILSRTSPNILDLMIALAGGAAGSIASTSPRLSSGLVGVAIATALVPPLAVCGISLAHGQPRLALGAFLLFFTNLVAIQIVSSLVLWLQGYHQIRVRSDSWSTLAYRNGPSLVIIGLLTIVLGVNFRQTLSKQRFERGVRASLETVLAEYPGVDLADLRFARVEERELVIAVLRTPVSFTPDRVRAVASRLPVPPGAKLELHIRSIITKETTETGYLHEEPKPDPAEDAVAPEIPELIQ